MSYDTTVLGPTPSVGAGSFQGQIDQDYHTMPYTNSSGSDIAAGSMVVANGLVGVAIGAIDNGKSGTLLILSTLAVVKAQEAISQGTAVYWDTDGSPYGGTALSGAATATATGNYFMGRAIATAGSTAATVRVLLIPNANQMSVFGYTDGAAMLSGATAQGTRSDSATQVYPLGMSRRYADGRVFRYVKARTALHTEFGAGYAAKTITCAIAPAQASGAGTAGQYYVTMSVAGGDGLGGDGVIALNELAGGYVVIGNGTSQHPQNRLILGNTATTGAGVCTLTLDEALSATVSVGVTTIETLMNPYILSDMYATNSAYVTARGLPACELTINHFGFVQTAGPVWITSNSATCDSANDRQIFMTQNGSCVSGGDVSYGTNHPIDQFIGNAIDMSGSASSNAPFVMLDLEVA